MISSRRCLWFWKSSWKWSWRFQFSHRWCWNGWHYCLFYPPEPGEFQFEQPHYYADGSQGAVTMNVIRQHGCDGTVTIEFSTMWVRVWAPARHLKGTGKGLCVYKLTWFVTRYRDGTARGGDALGPDVDYIKTDGKLHFKHGETSQKVSIEVNRETKVQPVYHSSKVDTWYTAHWIWNWTFEVSV